MLGKLGTRAAHAGGEKRDGWQDRHRMLMAAEADVRKDPRALDALLLRGALGKCTEARTYEARVEAALDACFESIFVCDSQSTAYELERFNACHTRRGDKKGEGGIDLF